MRQTVTVVTTSGTKDAYGNTKRADAASVDVLGFVDQTVSYEAPVDRDTIQTLATAYLPAGTVVGPFDHLIFQGRTFQVEGLPHLIANARTGAIHHVEVACKEVR